MKTKKQDYTILDKPNATQAAKKAAENREVWHAASLLGLQFVASCLVGILLGIGIAALAASL
jgi:F0F1-type ATP synthase assembly protein I